ncbi:hypothetical protein C7974DRAFT_402572 [Boeremia exigua]|uniref:uncharacterized protein n=1 Tax=Boeremia exigua TaxID=749465 RepID=UPI001E8CF92C|nr:uncharacterized protein C7974DRAFT_402572 [Boeremia exigua]KAH6616868.1 hypothetical protein C7974DRAFT_402572 [Boeremia exigua]
MVCGVRCEVCAVWCEMCDMWCAGGWKMVVLSMLPSSTMRGLCRKMLLSMMMLSVLLSMLSMPSMPSILSTLDTTLDTTVVTVERPTSKAAESKTPKPTVITMSQRTVERTTWKDNTSKATERQCLERVLRKTLRDIETSKDVETYLKSHQAR